MAQEFEVNLNIVPEPQKVNPKMESVISEMVDAFKIGGLAAAQQHAERHCVSLFDRDRIRVVIHSDDLNARNLIGAIPGVFVESVYEFLTQALVPLATLERIAAMPQVQFIRQPYYPQLSVISEGVDVTNAQAFHDAGITGEGVDVVVLDGGFEGYKSLLGTELPSTVITKSFSGDITEGGKHGTACAEIVHDMAPDASMYLVKVQTDVEFRNAVDWIIAQGVVDIVSVSLAWIIDSHDGTGDLDQKVDEARDAGILWVNAAGNYAQSHYQGTFLDTNGNKAHEFCPGSWEFCLVYGSYICGFLMWDDWSATGQDYDFYLYYWTGTTWALKAKSENDQAGGFPEPWEAICYSGSEGWYGFFILKWKTTRDCELELFTPNNSMDPADEMGDCAPVPESSVTTPATAFGALAVGAVDYHDYTPSGCPLESFSSRGPANDGRTKPDLSAPDGVSTVSYSPGPFYGTSAACPHVAGGAALVLSAQPSLTPDQLQEELMTTHAVDICAPGVDNDSGAGWMILNVGPTHTVTITSGPTANPSTIDSGGTTNLSVTATDSQGDAIAYSWTANPPEGSFSNPNAQNPTWTAPVNNTGADKVYTLTVTAKCTIDPNVKDTKSVDVTVKLATCPLVGDVSGNGVVTAYDAALILRFVVGLIDKFPVESQQSPITGTPQSYSIAVPHLTVATGNKIQAPIIINDASGVAAGGIVLRYDPKILRAINVVSSSLLSGYYWQFNTELDGQVRIAFAGNRIFSGNGALFYVEFEALPNNIGKISPLILEIAQVSENLDITKFNGSIAVLPTKSTLLQNYPNPFNPETWVPYLLVEPANATLKIYSATGKLVRTLDLGYKTVGIYLNKDRAAYWDGKDEHGESVASGAYFYSLQAGKFTATRKMVIVK